MKRVAYLFAVALAISPAWALAQDLAGFLKAGDDMRDKFDNKGALEQYRQAAAADPNNLDAQTRLAQALVDNGEDTASKESEQFYLEAVDVATKITQKNPTLAEGHYLLALAYGKLALFRGGNEKVKLSRSVERSGKKALELNPNHANAHILMGVYYREIANLSWILKKFANAFFGGLPAGTNEDSLQELKKAVEFNTLSVRARYELGKTLDTMGNKKEAAESYKKAAEIPMIDHMDAKYIAEAKLRLRDLR